MEKLKESGSGDVAFLAAAILLKMDSSRADLVTFLTDELNAVTSTRGYSATHILVALRFAGTNAHAAVPLLKKVAVARRNKDEFRLPIWALQEISPEAAWEALAARVQIASEEEDSEHLFWDIGLLIRTAQETQQQAALAAFQRQYDHVPAQAKSMAWRRHKMIASLRPDDYEKKPPEALVLFLKQVAEHDPYPYVRTAARQALKFFRLKWGIE